jgi:hypothetical protein
MTVCFFAFNCTLPALKETRWLGATRIAHNLHHAGDISHMRRLHQQYDE